MLAVHVIFEIEDPRKSGACGIVFSPGSVFVLSAEEVFDTALDGVAVRVAAGAESHNRPGGLAGGAGTATFEGRKVVRFAGFSPAAIVILAAFEPVARAADPLLVHVLADRGESAQNLPGAVDVVHAPASVPRSVGFLSAANHDQQTGRVPASGR